MKMSDSSSTNDAILEKMVSLFKDTHGDFNNATHKFYSMRKAYARSEPSIERTIMSITPNKFFSYMKSMKKAVVKPEHEGRTNVSNRPNEIEILSISDVQKNGTIGVISYMVRTYFEYFTKQEIIDAIMKSPVLDYEDAVFIRNNVESEYYSIKRDHAVTALDNIIVTEEEINSLKSSSDFETIMRYIGRDFKMLVKNYRMKDKNATYIFKKSVPSVAGDFMDKAVLAYSQNDVKKAKKNLLIKKTIESLTPSEFFTWYNKHKATL